MDSKNQMSMWLSGCRGYSKKKSVRCWSHLQKSEQMKKWKDTKYKIQEDKKVENKMIIGIDHGNRNMKTANTVFSAAIQPFCLQRAGAGKKGGYVNGTGRKTQPGFWQWGDL